MAKKNYYYVLVFTVKGPKYITSVDNLNKVAHWDEAGKPKDFSKTVAEDLAFCLRANFFNVVVVYAPVKIDAQPYLYNHYRIKWEEIND